MKPTIGDICRDAAMLIRAERIQAIRARHWDRLAEARHERLDNALWEAVRGERSTP